MKTLLLIITTCIAQFTFAQEQYEKAMGEALTLWGQQNTEAALGKMEQISSVEKDNWIPKYYQALIATTASFQENDLDKKNALIKKAKDIIPTTTENSNAEWYILKALTLTAELTIDPMNNAMRLSPEIIANYEKAKALEPNNPRAISGLADFNIQSKKFMGGNTDQECKDLQKALSLFATQKKDVKFYPSWGKERVEQLLKNCVK